MKENSIKEDIERLKLCSTNQCYICGRYEKEECMLERNRCEQHILSAYKRVLKENEELKETLKCTQNSWYEDTQKIEEMKKQIDLDNECEIALNSKVMDLEKEIEELTLDLEEMTKSNNHKKENWVHKSILNSYVSKKESEQKERKAYIKGTNDADELCNKKWEDKIKAKIEEYKNMLKTCNKAKDIDRIKAINERILELQELIEGEK